MEWLAIIGLAAFAWWQQQRIGALTHKLMELESRLMLKERAPMEVGPAPAAPPRPAEELEPLLLDTPLPPDELVLDTPLPVASNDDEPLVLDTPAPPLEEPVRMPPAAATPPPRIAKPRDRKLETWLAQNGFAWLGGALVAIGGILMVSFASQQPWFTPQVQLVCALALGLALIGGSEWARRRNVAQPPGSPLVAAMLASAGVVTLYAIAWAAHGLYGLVDYAVAALMLTLCAAILAGLSLLHGQALGVLAIALALLAPQITGTDLWPRLPLTFYLVGVGGAGFALAAWRRWPWVAIAAMVGLYFWFSIALAAEEIRRALALASFTAMGGVALAFRKPLADEAASRLTWTQTHAHLPAAVICISSVLLIWTWIAIATLPSGVIGGPAWVATMFVALAAAAVRARVAAPVTLLIAIASLVLGFASYLQIRFALPPLGPDFYPFTLLSSAVIVAAALGARPHRNSRALIAASGAIGAAVLTALAAFSRDNWHGYTAWTPLFLGAALLFVAAWLTADEVQDSRKDRATSFWVGGGAALLLLAIESAFPASVRTAAHAGAAALFAFGFGLRGWTMLRYTALVAGALAIGHALSPSLISSTLSGQIPLSGALIALAVAAVLLFIASAFTGRAEPRSIAAESLNAGAVFIILIAIFLSLRAFIAGPDRDGIDSFTEVSLRVIALIAAGHILMTRPGVETGIIGRWRHHVLIGAGLLYTFAAPALSVNPWWGATPATVFGPHIINTLLLAFAAPAALALFAARRVYEHQRFAGRSYATAGGILLLIWTLLETRRLFHGGAMARADVGLFEGACYALILLLTALAVTIFARLREARSPERPFTQDALTASRATAWFGIASAALILLALRHPWWGAQDSDTTNALSTLLAVLAHGVAIVVALFLGRALSRRKEVEPTRFAAAAAASVFAWSFGHLIIRWFYHRGLMDNGEPLAQLEGLAHAIWPLAFVLAASAVTARAPGRDTVRAYLYDLQALWASAIWPALVFTALGLWLLFNPWWGVSPATLTTPLGAIYALAALLLAAWMSTRATNVPHARWPDWLTRASTIAVVGHLFVTATLIVRWLYHREAMFSGAAQGAEMWIYSAVWALFGAAVFWLGMRRNDPLLRWIGLGLLLLTTLKVFLVDMARLGGVTRVASFVGLGLVLLAIAWAARRFAAAPPPAPTDLLQIKPSARRERRHGRRQRSS